MTGIRNLKLALSLGMVQALIVFQVHPLGKCLHSFLMSIHYAMGGYRE